VTARTTAEVSLRKAVSSVSCRHVLRMRFAFLACLRGSDWLMCCGVSLFRLVGLGWTCGLCVVFLLVWRWRWLTQQAAEEVSQKESQAKTIVSNLQTELGGTRQRLQAAERAIVELRARLQALGQEAQNTRNSAKKLEEELQLKTSEVDALKVAVTKAQHDTGTAANKADASAKEAARLNTDNNELKARVTAAENTIAEANRRLAAAGKVRCADTTSSMYNTTWC